MPSAVGHRAGAFFLVFGHKPQTVLVLAWIALPIDACSGGRAYRGNDDFFFYVM